MKQLIATGIAIMIAGAVFAQAQVGFGSLGQDTDAPVEITSEQLDVNDADSSAVFTGDVVIGQGDMRLAADRVLVRYLKDGGGIRAVEATGNVTLVSGDDAAEGQRADYDIQNGNIVITGDALLVQGNNVISSDRMVVDLSAGTARMEGRVKSILRGNN